MLSSFLRFAPIKKIIGVAIFIGLTFLIFNLLRFFNHEKPSTKVEELSLIQNNQIPNLNSAANSTEIVDIADQPSKTHLTKNTLSSIPLQDGKINPDLLLIDVYRNLADNQFKAAQSKIDTLLKYYPNFQLAHLIQGDLIAMRAKPTVQFGATHRINDMNTNNSPNNSDAKLKDLHDEAIARLKAITERPDKESIPSNLLQMSNDQKYVLVMDAKRARIYLYENKLGVPTLLGDYYVSQGKLGIDKFREGDQRTPLGVYFITSRLAGAKLPDFYGPGALPINYPNEWDKRNGRGGSGIWLHGVPSGNYSRPPLASDGCIVLSNPDFIHVADTVDKTQTPVIVSDKIQFIDHAQWEKEKKLSLKLIENWRLDLESNNINQIISHYSVNYKGYASETLPIKMAKQQKLLNDLGHVKVAIKDIYQYKYPGKTDMIVSGFYQIVNSSRGSSTFKNQQYWAKENNQWKIVYEEQTFVSGVNVEPIYAKNDNKIPSNTKAISTTEDNSIAVNKVTKPTDKPSNSEQKTIASTVENWANSWSKQNINSYFAHYDKNFVTPNGVSKKEWMDDRRDRIVGKKTIYVKVESMNIQVGANTATVKFRQKYQSGSLNANTRKTLLMVKQDGKWLIKQESTGA